MKSFFQVRQDFFSEICFQLRRIFVQLTYITQLYFVENCTLDITTLNQMINCSTFIEQLVSNNNIFVMAHAILYHSKYNFETILTKSILKLIESSII